jgi:hypothetical protein
MVVDLGDKAMKYFLGGMSLILVGFWMVWGIPQSKTQLSASKSGLNRAPVVVELFTSEGCSSCPSADALLATLYKNQPIGGAEVIALEEHVDYWDDLGWKDPFSSHEWTRRQEEYAGAFRSGSVYTPQMVVDGQAEFVGSRERQSEKEISDGARRAKTPVTVSRNGSGADGAAQFAVRVGRLAGTTSGDLAEVCLAIAENDLQSSVTRGENAGEQLRHTSVLRTLRKIGVADPAKDESFSGSTLVKLDSSWKQNNSCVIVFVQERASRKILGAAEAEISR